MATTAFRASAPATRSAAPARPAAPAATRARPFTPPTRPTTFQTAPPTIRLNTGASVAAPGNAAELTTGGEPLVPAVRAALEHSFRADLRAVRVHSDTRAHNAARGLSARAFTYGNQIFLGSGERPTDLALMGHEVAHVLHQQRAPAIQRWTPGNRDAYEDEAHRASSAVLHREPFDVKERTNGPRVQRLGLSDALDYFADKANLIPGFRMFTIILGVNPVNMSPVQRSAANILRALVEFIPGGGLIVQALDQYGVFDKVGAWIEEQIKSLGLVGSAIKQAVTDFFHSLSFSDIFDLGGVWQRAKRIFTEPIDRIISFGKGLVDGIIKFVKEAILRPLAKLAEGTRGYDLLKAILGQNPVTGDPVERSADTLIGGFMKLIGQEDVWENIKKANAIARCWAWFQGALGTLLGFLRQIPQLFVQALQSLTLEDIVLLPRAFAKVVAVFGDFVGRFISWAGDAVWNLLQIIFEVVAPGAIPYIKKVGAAFKTILKNPIGFVLNLVKAGKLGFQQFADNIGAHLKASFIEWLTGSLEGVYIPKALELREIIKFVLSVLGLTWQNIRGKLVKVLGEPAVKAMETAFDIVVTLVREGPAAAWEKIKEEVGNLKDMVMSAIMDFVIETIVKKAVAKVLSLLVPGGAFIQAIISIYDTIMVFVEKLKKIIQVVMAFLDGIVAIASGEIAGAANKVESTLAGLLTLAISFLAGFLGLGKIADKVMNIINTKVRQPIDKALDKVIDWIVKTVKKLFPPGAPAEDRLDQGLAAAQSAVNRFAGKRVGDVVLRPLLGAIKLRYRLLSLDVVPDGNRWAVEGQANPKRRKPTQVLTPAELTPGAGEKVLLLGEGDFSFSLSLVSQTLPAARPGIVATERAAPQELKKLYPETAAANIGKILALGATVQFGVDAANIGLTLGKFQTIVFTFPFLKGPRDADLVKRNIDLIRGFLASAADALEPGGRVVLTTSQHWARRWRPEELAPPGLYKIEERTFKPGLFPGYGHQMSHKSGSAKVDISITFIYTAQFKPTPG